MYNNINDIDFKSIAYNHASVQPFKFYIKKLNNQKIEKLAKKHKLSKSYILDLILDKIKT